jgi:hypothetical protein
MDLESDFIFDDMCELFFPAIEWMLEECDDVEEKDIPKLLTEDDEIDLDQAKRIFAAYKENNA